MLTKVISSKSVGFDKETVLELVMSNKDTDHFLYRVFGVIEGHEIGRSHFKRVNKETGEAENTMWTKFFGEFFAVTRTGQQYEAATCFLPSYVSGQFVTDLTDGGATVSFAFDVYAVYSKQSATSYEFIAQAVREEGKESKLDQMKAAMLGNVPVAQIEDKAHGKKKAG